MSALGIGKVYRYFSVINFFPLAATQNSGRRCVLIQTSGRLQQTILYGVHRGWLTSILSKDPSGVGFYILLENFWEIVNRVGYIILSDSFGTKLVKIT